MATGQEIWDAAKAAVRGVLLSHRPDTTVWTTLTPEQVGCDADSWRLWSAAMVSRFNTSDVKPTVALSIEKRRPYRKKAFIEFAKALRDA